MTRVTGTSVRRRLSLWDPGHLLALGLGTGLVPRAPGTAGSLLALPLFLGLAPFGVSLHALAVAALFILGIYVAGRSARALGVHDHGAIVIDEVAGMLLTWIGAPPGLAVVIVGFVLFRLFDILKPWPIGYVDRHLAGGTGIMLDDLLAGALAAGVLQLLLHAPLTGAILAS